MKTNAGSESLILFLNKGKSRPEDCLEVMIFNRNRGKIWGYFGTIKGA